MKRMKLMNERGFFTIVGLCLLLVAAISIKGIQEFETNYASGANEALIENELQNIADSALIAAIYGENYTLTVSDKLKNLDVKIDTPERRELTFRQFTRRYSGSSYQDISVKINVDNENKNKKINGTVFIRVASCNSPYIVGRIYRCSMAYITEDGIIHFMNDVPK